MIKALEKNRATKTRTAGSHRRYESACGQCHTTVSGHPGDEMPKGTLRAIERDMQPCYGAGWLR